MDNKVQPITPMKITTNFPTGKRVRDTRFFKDKFVRVDTFEIKGKPTKVRIAVFEDPFDTKPKKSKWKVRSDEKRS